MATKHTAKPSRTTVDPKPGKAPTIAPTKNKATAKPKVNQGFTLETQVPSSTEHRHKDLEAAITLVNEKFKKLEQAHEKLTRKVEQDHKDEIEANVERDARIKVFEEFLMDAKWGRDYDKLYEDWKKKFKFAASGKLATGKLASGN